MTNRFRFLTESSVTAKLKLGKTRSAIRCNISSSLYLICNSSSSLKKVARLGVYCVHATSTAKQNMFDPEPFQLLLATG